MIGNKIIWLEEINSTNDFLKVNCPSLTHGTICTSKIQTAGRGRRNNSWQSNEGNLYFSILLKEKVSYKNVFAYMTHISTALVEVLELKGIQATIKYPNDIMVGSKKIAGILMETIGSNTVDCLIVGVGINVNQKEFFELNNKATSIINETTKKEKVSTLLTEIIQKYNQLESNSSHELMEKYVQKSSVIGKEIVVDNRQYTIEGILKDGNLQLRSEDELIYIGFNEISLEELYDNKQN